MKSLLRLSVIITLAVPAWGVTNSITLRNNGSTVTNYPLQFARPFVRGEIADYPQIGLCALASSCGTVTTWFTTQADRKTQWDDGSFKHGIISVIITPIAAGSREYTFRNQASCNCGVGLTKTEMLDAAYNFDATILATPPVGTAHTASARTMLNADAFQYWAAGTVATTVIIADLTPTRSYHFGWEQTGVMSSTTSIATGVTSITVSDASALTTPTYARMYIPLTTGTTNHTGVGEDILISSKSVNTLTVVRAQHSTTSSSAGIMVAGTAIAPDNAWQDPSSSTYEGLIPIFIATFWTATNNVYTRFALEASDSSRLQDQVYDVVLKTGNTSPTTELTQSGYIHRASTSWTRAYWQGTDPGTVDIIHNMDYLASTSIFFNYNTTYIPPTNQMDTYWSNMQSKGTALGNLGPYQTYSMAVGGGREEIGPETAWHIDWLLTGYDKIRQVVFASADIGPSWQCMLREGDSSKKYDRAGLVSAFGKPIVPTNRKTLRVSTGYDSASSAGDDVNPVGPYSFGPFVGGTTPFLDAEHLYNAAMPLYVVTGDWYYYQIGLGTASMNWMTISASTTTGRGPTGAEGALLGLNVRGQAWPTRNRAQMATFSPDGTPEKTLFTEALRDHVAATEGVLRFSNSYSGDTDYTTMYNWGRSTYNGNNDNLGRYTVGAVISPMGLLKFATGFAQPHLGIDTTYTQYAASTFELGYFTIAERYVYDMGFYPIATNKLLANLAKYYTGAVTNPDANRFVLLGALRTPATKLSDSSLIATWADMQLGYWATEAISIANGGSIGGANPKWRTMTSFVDIVNTGSTDYVSMAAIPAIANQVGGGVTWAFAQSQRNSFFATGYGTNPMWALWPRTVEITDTGAVGGLGGLGGNSAIK